MQFFCQPQNNPLKLSWSSYLGVGFLEMCSQWVLRCNKVFWKYRDAEWNWRKLIHRYMAQLPSVGGHSPAVREPHTQNLEWACPGPLCPRFSFVSSLFYASKLWSRFEYMLNMVHCHEADKVIPRVWQVNTHASHSFGDLNPGNFTVCGEIGGGKWVYNWKVWALSVKKNLTSCLRILRAIRQKTA